MPPQSGRWLKDHFKADTKAAAHDDQTAIHKEVTTAATLCFNEFAPHIETRERGGGEGRGRGEGEREREGEGGRERDRQTDRQTDRDRQTETQRERERESR